VGVLCEWFEVIGGFKFDKAGRDIDGAWLMVTKVVKLICYNWHQSTEKAISRSAFVVATFHTSITNDDYRGKPDTLGKEQAQEFVVIVVEAVDSPSAFSLCVFIRIQNDYIIGYILELI